MMKGLERECIGLFVGEGFGDIPLGCVKSPFSTPVLIALLNIWSNWPSEVVARPLLLALTYFLRA